MWILRACVCVHFLIELILNVIVSGGDSNKIRQNSTSNEVQMFIAHNCDTYFHDVCPH